MLSTQNRTLRWLWGIKEQRCLWWLYSINSLAFCSFSELYSSSLLKITSLISFSIWKGTKLIPPLPPVSQGSILGPKEVRALKLPSGQVMAFDVLSHFCFPSVSSYYFSALKRLEIGFSIYIFLFPTAHRASCQILTIQHKSLAQTRCSIRGLIETNGMHSILIKY